MRLCVCAYAAYARRSYHCSIIPARSCRAVWTGVKRKGRRRKGKEGESICCSSLPRLTSPPWGVAMVLVLFRVRRGMVGTRWQYHQTHAYTTTMQPIHSLYASNTTVKIKEVGRARVVRGVRRAAAACCLDATPRHAMPLAPPHTSQNPRWMTRVHRARLTRFSSSR